MFIDRAEFSNGNMKGEFYFKRISPSHINWEYYISVPNEEPVYRRDFIIEVMKYDVGDETILH